MAFAHHAFGFMYFGDLWNFLDLLHRFCKSPQLVLTQLLQCSIVRRAPSKTVSYFLIEQLSRLAFLLSSTTLCDDIAFELFTNLQTFCATTRLNFAFVTFSCCFLLQPACAWQFLLTQSLTKLAHLSLFANFMLPVHAVLICWFNRCFFLDCYC